MSKTVISLLGTQLDRGRGPKRWERWRPTVSIFQHEGLFVDRLLLLADPRNEELSAVVLEDIRRLSPETELVPVPLPLEDPWDFEEVYAALYDFARRARFGEEEELLVHISTGSHVAQICLFLLCESRHLPGALLQTGPPRRGTEPGGSFHVIDLDLERYGPIAARFARERTEARDLLKAGIETRSEAYNRLIERIEQVAVGSDAPILLTGPTGAGKSRLARRIYALKRERQRVRGPLVEVNCATLRGDGAMSALFGHVRGAFTGADRDRAGLLKSADQGALFLDEIGELGADEQAMLLYAVEERRWLPVGADREVSADFLLLAGSNRDLRAEVRAGRFREDLLARIDLWHFRLPGLRERPEDLAPNLDYELERWSERSGEEARMSKEARALFLRFAEGPAGLWRASFRDLSAAVTRMATLAAGRRIDRALVEEEIERLERAWAPSEPEGEAQGERGASWVERRLGPAAAELDRFDRVQLEEVLRVCAASPSLSAAGRALFAESRKKKAQPNDADRLRKYLLRFGLRWQEVGG